MKVRKLLVQIEEGQTTRWDADLCCRGVAVQIQDELQTLVGILTSGQIPQVTVIDEEAPAPCRCGGLCPACAGH